VEALWGAPSAGGGTGRDPSGGDDRICRAGLAEPAIALATIRARALRGRGLLSVIGANIGV
jgi:hypothetical protein